MNEGASGVAKNSRVRTHEELQVFQRAFEAAMQLFEYSKGFPKEETYSLTDQMRRSSRGVAANLAEAWRKRRYQAAFIAKLSDAETEAAETQVWIKFAARCRYLEKDQACPLYDEYDAIIGTIIGMINHPETGTIKNP